MNGPNNPAIDAKEAVIKHAAREIVARYPETAENDALRFATQQFDAMYADLDRKGSITAAAIVELANKVEGMGPADDVRIRDDLKQVIFNELVRRQPERGVHHGELAVAFKEAADVPLSICNHHLSQVLAELKRERYVVVRGEGQLLPVYVRGLNFQRWVKAMTNDDSSRGSVTNNTTTYNVSGQGARVNVNSTDNSNNIVGDGAKVDVQGQLANLRNAIDTASELSDAERQSAHQVVDAVQAEFQKESPVQAVVTALLSGLPKIAAVASISSAIHAWFF